MMSSASAVRKRYIALKASGFCVRCGVENTRDGLTKCAKCIEDSKRRYAENKSDDYCNSCRRNKPAPGMKQCASCRILGRAAAARKRAAKVSK